ADACDFARFCSALDFWSINDHAFSVTPAHWRETVDSLRRCNAVAGDARDPDTVAYLGWEWTQVGATPETHFGHKNVVLRDLDGPALPARPIAAAREGEAGPGALARIAMTAAGDARLRAYARYLAELDETPRCDAATPSPELPDDCLEQARTPADLFRKLDEWEAEAIVVPHGTAWGFYTPPGSTWDKQLAGAMHSEHYQRLFEVYSGHGSSEVYRPWRAVELDAAGNPHCPPPRADYEPMCWRAGEIIRARCLAEGASSDECDLRAEEARANAARAGASAHLTVPGATAAEWLDAGQCRDCDEPAFHYRPGGSAQYVLALSDFASGDAVASPRRFHFGLLASSDNHFARPGTGFKEFARSGNTESRSPPPGGGTALGPFAPEREEPVARSRAFRSGRSGFAVRETERQASFLTTGGLVAVHADARDRGAIWDALVRREVYGTSGPRILLWFDLLNAPGARGRPLPMGGEARMAGEPIFQVRAVGSFEQLPGCPDDATDALSPERLAHLCKGECYHPSDVRRPITRIEVVRIRPQAAPGEDVAALVDDPWRTFACDGDPAGCVVHFSDAEFASAGRDALYYVRAYEAETPAINAGNLRCDRDATGACVRAHPCPGPAGAADDCLAPHEPRAWSSPIRVDHARGTADARAPRSEAAV
ncbi:MAG: DUF3604 domain-containing protein, partial [Myxococcales bacterium]|nr:DUF3604 domain-containing protein [Myxococcales bacterium]